MMFSSPPLLLLRVTTVMRPSAAHPSVLMMSPWKAMMCVATPRPIPRTAKSPPLLLALPLALLLAPLPAHLLSLLEAPLAAPQTVTLTMMVTMTSIRAIRRTECCCSSRERSPPSLVPPPPPVKPPNLHVGRRSANLTSLTVPSLRNSVCSSCNAS